MWTDTLDILPFCVFFTIYAANTLQSAHLSKTLTHLDKLGMESIVEKIIPTVGLGTATEYDIPLDKVETETVVDMDLTTKIACLDDNENIPESAALQSSSARESQCNCLLRQRSPYQLSSKNILTLNSDNYINPSALRSPTMSTMIQSWTKFTKNTSRIIQTY